MLSIVARNQFPEGPQLSRGVAVALHPGRIELVKPDGYGLAASVFFSRHPEPLPLPGE